MVGALIFEGLAKNEEEAQDLAASGKINFAPCHEHDAVGPMAGIISASMPVHIIVNKTYGNFAYCHVNEGLGKVLRFGAYSSEVIDRLHWMKDELMPTLKAVLKLSGGIEIRSLIAQALHMGDECHNRNKAATSLFVRAIAPYFLKIDIPSAVAARVLEFIQSNDHYFLNLSMPACKATMDAAHGIPYSTIVTTMARNGVEFGIRVVYVNFGKPNQRALSHLSVAEALRYLDEGQFPPGSMGPKIEAAIRFASSKSERESV